MEYEEDRTEDEVEKEERGIRRRGRNKAWRTVANKSYRPAASCRRPPKNCVGGRKVGERASRC